MANYDYDVIPQSVNNISLLSQSRFGTSGGKKWLPHVVRSLFLLLMVLCSISVGWFFAGGNFDIQLPQTSDDVKVMIAEPIVDEELIDAEIAVELDLPPPHCVRQKDRLYFLKTHKTASSVIENILYRYGLSRNKTFAMPKDGGLVFNYRKPFQTKMVRPLPSGEIPDILQQHTRYSQQVETLFPMEDSFRITILRDPGTLFPSLFKYFSRNDPFRKAKTLTNFMTDPQKYSATGGDFVTRNSMTFQMGFDNYLKTEPSDEMLGKILRALDENFNLVMLSEYVPQSLILLRHLLCLSWNDIATLSKNISARKHFDESMKVKMRKWQNIDTLVYHTANVTFWGKVEEFGRDKMDKEVEILRKIAEENSEKCVESYKPVKQLPPEFRDYEPPGLTIEGIQLKEGYSDVCYQIALSPFALAIDNVEQQCQDSSFLRKFAHLEDRPRTYGLHCKT